MTTSGVATSYRDCGVDEQDVDISAPYHHRVVVDKDADKHADRVPELDMDDVDQPTVALPPDGGWGWAVVAAAFISNLIVGGICYMFGIIMPELLEHFQAGKGKTAFVGSMVPGTLSVVGKSISRHVQFRSSNQLVLYSTDRYSPSSRYI